MTTAGARLDSPRGGASPRPRATEPAPANRADAASGVRTLSDVVRNPENAPLDVVCHKRNVALLNEWRAERRETIAGKPAGHARSQSWPPLNRDEILRAAPPLARAPSAPPTAGVEELERERTLSASAPPSP